MARNRKGQSEGLLLGPALKASVICLVIVIFCVGYVWEKKQISDLSRQILSQENQLAALKDTNDKLKKQLAGLLSPVALDKQVKDLKLGLVPPQPSQIWRLPEPPAEKSANGRTPQFASQEFNLLDLPDLR
jgi:hypothetical protein